MIIAHQRGASQLRLDVLAFLYIVLRLLYIMMYVADLATVRSLVWLLALVANIAILFA
ncbi:MAPEG family protein [Hydrogenophaga sp.]|uniref:MAPEG family protein n=1 Tax=Hydrogenophaga sp. TaxID=1904254 RepID=UPI0035223BEA